MLTITHFISVTSVNCQVQYHIVDSGYASQINDFNCFSYRFRNIVTFKKTVNMIHLLLIDGRGILKYQFTMNIVSTFLTLWQGFANFYKVV